MTLNEFVYKNLKKGVDFDGHYGLQCVDLFRQYCQDVWDIPQPEGVTGAVDFFTKYDKKPILKKHLERLSYPAHKPAEGDAVVFGTVSGNPYGHIGIVVASFPQAVVVLEQDGYKQDGVKIEWYSYRNVLGFLRKRKAARLIL